ncbi:target of Nesh-SH3 [Ambystoma mexicanum]|uniref:target of Nesh-SH3 n=1 Tax=Ambystoma mexicanum TaxID=8296 RepID=UPI0037E8E6FC
MGASGVSRLLCLLFCWNFAGNLGDAQKLPGVKKASLKVQINATSDTVILKFLRPSPNMNLEGFILGYGSSFFSTQYIPMPENGKSYDAELDAEPRYLVAVRPSPIVNTKKSCSGQPKVQKPLQVVVGTLSPSSVYLAWGVLVNPQYDWTVLNKCPTDRFYTVRYREKEKNKKWLFQLCPNTETVVDNLKPNVIYEFGVKDNSEDGIWNKGVTHKTTVPPKHKINGGNGHIQNTYNGPKGNIQMAPEDAKMLVPITVIKQVVQNISIPKKPKSTVAPSSTVTKAATEIHTGHEKSKTDLVYTERGLESPKAHVTTTPGLALSTPAAERKSQRSTTTLTSTGDLETARAPTAFYEEKFISASSLEPDSAEAASTESAPSSGDQETTGPILSSALQLLGTTLAVNDTRPLPEILGTPEEPEIHKTATTETAKHQTTQEPLRASIYTSSEHPESTLVSNELPPLVRTPKTTAVPEIQITHPEIHEMTQEPPTVIPDTSPKLPDSTSVSIEPTVFPSREDTSAAPEIRGSKPVSSKQRIPDPILPRASQIQEQPKATVGVYETPFISQEPRSSEGPERPQTNPALWTSLKPLTTKPSQGPRTPKPALGPKEPMIVPPKLSSSAGTDRPQSKPAPTESQTFSSSKPKTAEDARLEAVPNEIYKFPSAKPKATQTTNRPLATPAPKKTQRVPINLIRLQIFGDPNMTSVPNEIHKFPSAKPKATQTTERPLATSAPKKTQRAPINLIRLHIFGDTDLSSVPNETQTMSSSKAKQVHPTERPHTKAAPKSTHRVPINHIKLHIFEDLKETLVPNETQKAPSSKPASQATEVPRVKAVPEEESHIDSSKPKISIPHPVLETTQAPQKVHPSSSRPKTSARPRSRPVPNRTTQVTAQPRSNNLNWISETAIGGKLNGQDNTKLLGVSRNTSMEPNGTVRRPVSGSTPRVPLAPARPTHMRRRLLHPSNVTGRPGMPGNGLIPRAPSSSMRFMPKPTQVVTVERTQRLKEKTTSAPEQETVTEPIFNANPVSEIDPVGKPRYTAPHVKYMRKEDLVPCSITESLKHFPKELATNEEEATAAPQNPPSNLTVVAVEGCPSFVILDWEQPNNDTVTEYKVISKENGAPSGKDQSISTTNQTHSTVENLKPDTSYEFKVIASNIIGEGPPSTTVTHNTESADPRVSEPLPGGKDAIWTEIKFKSDTYSECKGKQYVKRTWYKKFVGIQLCNSLRYKIYLSDKLSGKFYNIGDESGYGEDHCQFVDSFLDGRTGQQLLPEQLPSREGFYRSVRQQPVEFGKMGSQTHVRYVHWYECGTTIPGKW